MMDSDSDVCSKKVSLATALYDAIEDENIRQLTTILVDRHADPNTLLPQHGFSPFHFIIGNENPGFAEEVAKLFLRHGGDPNILSEEKMSPVHIAAAWGCTKILHLLLVNGGNPWLRDIYNKNAFHYAFQERNWDAVELLHKFHMVESSRNQSLMETNFQMLLERIILSAGDMCIEYGVTGLQKSSKCANTQTDQLYKGVCNLKTSKEEVIDRNIEKVPKDQEWLEENDSCDIFSQLDESDGNKSIILQSSNKSLLLPCKNDFNSYQVSNKYTDYIHSKIGDTTSVQNNSFEVTCCDKKSTKVCVSPDGSAESDTVPVLGPSASPEVYYNCERITNWLTMHSDVCSNRSSSTYYTCGDDDEEEEEEEEEEDDDVEIIVDSTNSCARKSKIQRKHSILASENLEKMKIVKQDDTNSDAEKSYVSNCSSVKTILTVSEEYKYTDDKEGIVLLERRFMPTPVSISDFPDLNSSGGQTDSFDTDILREELKARGYAPGPITATTKRVYRRQLRDLPPAPALDNRVYSPELERTLKDVDLQPILTPCINLEKEVSSQFAVPDPKLKWRGGLVKSSFTYLLLDPRITNNLPYQANELSINQIWKTFLSSIFYIGKGKRSRPYSHLYEAVAVWNKKSSSNSKKLNRIVEIWEAGLGVVCLHVFQNVIPAEAYTREAAMIDAIGLKNLCNIRHSEYYGKAATWNSRDKRLFGMYLLHRAMQIFLSEGERQLRPGDIG